MPKPLIIPGMSVAVMGLGVTGLAAVRYCLHCGARVIVSDCRDDATLKRECGEFLAEHNLEWEAGGHTVAFLMQAELVIISPGIADDHDVVRQLRASGTKVVGELAVAAPHLDSDVIAVTGTNGKTTVTSLIGEIFRNAGKKVFVGGNIGTPLFDYLRQGDKADVIVLEVSSFQLENAGDFAPRVAVLLNITPDHLDRHGSLEQYAEAKMKLFRNQRAEDIAVICGDDKLCRHGEASIPSQVTTFGSASSCEALIEGLSIIVNSGEGEVVYDLSGTALGNGMGVLNGAAALLATSSLGIDAETIRETFATFQPAPHRMELVAVVDGVSYINDSKATNTGAVIAALNQLSANAVLIVGGRDKGEDYRLMRDAVARKVREVIVIGEAAADIKTALTGCAEIRKADSLMEAVQTASMLAAPGEVVLLSPACASFDMFRSYGHRGEVFRAAVQSLQDERKIAGAAYGG